MFDHCSAAIISGIGNNKPASRKSRRPVVKPPNPCKSGGKVSREFQCGLGHRPNRKIQFNPKLFTFSDVVGWSGAPLQRPLPNRKIQPLELSWRRWAWCSFSATKKLLSLLVLKCNATKEITKLIQLKTGQNIKQPSIVRP